MRFICNCLVRRKNFTPTEGPLFVQELFQAKIYWISIAQVEHFDKELRSLWPKMGISRASPLFSLNPFMDEAQLLRVGGRKSNSK